MDGLIPQGMDVINIMGDGNPSEGVGGERGRHKKLGVFWEGMKGGARSPEHRYASGTMHAPSQPHLLLKHHCLYSGFLCTGQSI